MKTKIKGDELRLEVVFDSANYGKVLCKIKILDNIALATFSDRRLARDMYKKEKDLGIDDVYFHERISAIGTKYPNKTKEEIAKNLVKKFEEHNIGVKQI